MHKAALEEKIEITFVSLSKNSAWKNNNNKKARNPIAKLFALHANTIRNTKTYKQNQN